MNAIRVAALVLCIGLGTCHAAQISLTSSKDTTIYEDSDDLSNGGGSFLFAGATANKNSGLVRRALLGFDLTDLPTDVTITAASLQMRVNKAPNSPVRNDMGLHRLLQDWGEGSSDASGNEGKGALAGDGDATWSDAILGTSLWKNAGGDFVADDSSSASVAGTGTYTWESTDLMVADVQLWLDNPELNFGWILIGNEQVQRTAKRFDSRGTRTESNRPTLVIDFEAPSISGDFNSDGAINVLDIDLMCDAINQGDNPNGFDLNEDGSVTLGDLSTLVEDRLGTLIGDADLNKTVAFADFLQLSNNFNGNGNWSLGDFDCTGTVAFPDFLGLSTNFGKTAGQAASLASVPEPASSFWPVFALLAAFRRKRSRRQHGRYWPTNALPRKTLTHVFVLIIASWTASFSSAAIVGQFDDFESGVAGWRVGGGGPVNGPNVVADGGVDGAFLNYTTDHENTGGRFLIMNSDQWSGDYLAAGISGIAAVAKNEGDVELNMRLLVEGLGGGFFSSHAALLPVASEWQDIYFALSASDLTGGDDLAKTLASVSQIRIFHNPSPAFPGPFTNASMSIDNIRAVPEASTLTMLLGMLGCAAMSRRRVAPRCATSQIS